MRYGICIVIGAPCLDSSTMVSETFDRALARSACANGLRREHEQKKELLRRLGIPFLELEPPPSAANFIYTRDQAIFTRTGRVLFCSMRRPERRPEVAVFKQTFGTGSSRVQVQEAVCLVEVGGEGADLEGGDSVQWGGRSAPRAALFRSRRSTAKGLEVGVAFLEHEGYRVDVLDTQELHGTSGVSVIGEDTMLVNPEMADLRRIQALGVKTLIVPERERRTLAANAAWYSAQHTGLARDVVICNRDHPETAELLEGAGYQVETIDFTHHHLGEGNTDCAMGQRYPTFS